MSGLRMKYSERPCTTCGKPRAFVSGKWLRTVREGRGLSLREVARRLGFTAAYICDLELDRRNVSEALAQRFLAACS